MYEKLFFNRLFETYYHHLLNLKKKIMLKLAKIEAHIDDQLLLYKYSYLFDTHKPF